MYYLHVVYVHVNYVVDHGVHVRDHVHDDHDHDHDRAHDRVHAHDRDRDHVHDDVIHVYIYVSGQVATHTQKTASNLTIHKHKTL